MSKIKQHLDEMRREDFVEIHRAITSNKSMKNPLPQERMSVRTDPPLSPLAPS
jgi:hypothetical protein